MLSYEELGQLDHVVKFNNMVTKEFRVELLSLLKARCPLLYLATNEEKRLLDFFRCLASAFGYKVYTWDCFVGLVDLVSNKPPENFPGSNEVPCDSLGILNILYDKVVDLRKQIQDKIVGEIYILQDFYYYLDPSIYEPEIERGLKQISMVRSPSTVIVTGPVVRLPPSLKSEFSILDFPCPSDSEIEEVLDNLVDSVIVQMKELKTGSELADSMDGLRKELEEKKVYLVQAARGLTLRDVKMAMSKSVAKDKTLDIQCLLDITEEAKKLGETFD